MKRFFSTLIMTLLMFTFVIPSTYAEEKGIEKKEDQKKSTKLVDDVRSAILIERDTGSILFEKNSKEELAAGEYDKNYDDAANHGSIG